MPRKHPRVWLDTQVESLASGVTSIGRAENLSVGGLLVYTRQTFDPRTDVVVRFSLPRGHAVEGRGVVAHANRGVRMGIRFTELKEEDRVAIEEFVQAIQPYTRRGPRLARRLSVVLRWRDLEGNEHDEPAETMILTRYGGSLLSPTIFKPGQDIFLWWPERMRGARARIIFRQLGGAGNLAELGFEFVDAENFWGIDFAADTTW
jgi:glutaredoxin